MFVIIQVCQYASYLAIINNDHYLNIPTHHIDCFTMMLDPDNFEDYCNPGKGSDMLLLNRNPDGEIASYLIFYKGKFRPTTPWSHMHKDDFPLIEKFIAKSATSLDTAQAGAMRRISPAGNVSIFV